MVTKKQIKEILENLDLEFAIATSVIEKETGKKVELPEGLEQMLDQYWRYILSRLKEEFKLKQRKD